MGDDETFSDPRRRSPRVAHRVPLAVTTGKGEVTVTSIVVNAHGALVESPVPFEPGATLTVRDETLIRQVEAWVIWCGRAPNEETYDVGIEFARPDPAFWGPTYRGARRRDQ